MICAFGGTTSIWAAGLQGNTGAHPDGSSGAKWAQQVLSCGGSNVLGEGPSQVRHARVGVAELLCSQCLLLFTRNLCAIPVHSHPS